MNEEKTIEFMIHLYCKKNHTSTPCDECSKLLTYAKKRKEMCRHKDINIFCSTCKTHCYSPLMREKIRDVMRFSGPRMLFYNPKLAVYHIICTCKDKLRRD